MNNLSRTTAPGIVSQVHLDLKCKQCGNAIKNTPIKKAKALEDTTVTVLVLHPGEYGHTVRTSLKIRDLMTKLQYSFERDLETFCSYGCLSRRLRHLIKTPWERIKGTQ